MNELVDSHIFDYGCIVSDDDSISTSIDDFIMALISSGLSKGEIVVALAVWLKTIRLDKEVEWIPNYNLGCLTKINDRRCSTIKNKLFVKKVLVQEGRKVGINKNLSSWRTVNN